MLVKLDDRLKAVASLVLPGRVAADIGTDHNYLPVFLVQNGICERVIASDRASGPYRNAVALVARLNLAPNIDVRLGEGLEVLKPGEAATIIIAGMGGRLLIDILSAAPIVLESTERLVLQPQKDLPLLRYWLAEHGWRIIREEMAFDSGFYYTVVAAEHGRMELSPEQAEFGPCLLADRPPLWEQYLRYRLGDIDQLLEKLSSHASREISERKQYLQQERNQIANLLVQKPLHKR